MGGGLGHACMCGMCCDPVAVWYAAKGMGVYAWGGVGHAAEGNGVVCGSGHGGICVAFLICHGLYPYMVM